MGKLILVLGLTCILSGIASATTDKVVCYYGSWSYYRNGDGKFTVDDIHPSLCTHLIYTFVGIKSDGSIRIMDPWLEGDLDNFNRFTALKQKNPKLKTLIAIGGWNEGSLPFSTVAADPQKRATLLKSALDLIQTYKFDGFDWDWEYPNQRGGNAADVANFATLLKEFRVELDKRGLIQTAAVAASSASVAQSYDVPSLSKYLDFINVMAYDLHGAWEPTTGQNAPLYASSKDVTDTQKLLNVDSAIKGWISSGADPNKLVLGLGVYGRTFTLSNPNNNKLGDPISSGGLPGKYTSETGNIGYNELCVLQKEGGWTVVWDDVQKVPYMTKGNQWIGYDNPKSIAIKVNYAKSLNLGGVMIWSIETEDFRGNCGDKYPILNAIKSAMDSSNENIPIDPPDSDSDSGSDSKTTKKPVTAAPKVTTAKTVVNDLCTQEGYKRDPNDCNCFYYCLWTGSQFVPLKQQCNSNLYFDEEAMTCNYPELVNC